MRRKPSQNNGGYNQNRNKPRYQGGGDGGHRGGHGGHGHGRQRKNYSALREKYLAQARDALSSGDRVLAENYFQHADHCYRMMVEEGYHIRNNPPAQPSDQPQEQPPVSQSDEEDFSGNGNQLPAFITATPEEPNGASKPVDPSTIQNWEERDA